MMTKQILIIIYILTLSIVATCNAAELIRLSVATVEEFKPYIWNEKERIVGIDADIVNELGKRLGIKIIWIQVPWKRVLSFTKNGLVDASIAAFKTPAREQFAYFIDTPLHFSTYYLFVRKDRTYPFQSTTDLIGKEIGINRGFSLGELFDKLKKNNAIKVQEVDSTIQNIQKLMAGRIDAFIGNGETTCFELKQTIYSGKIKQLPTPVVPPKGAYMMISKKANIRNKQQVIQQINQIMRGMDQDGTIKAIRSRYLD